MYEVLLKPLMWNGAMHSQHNCPTRAPVCKLFQIYNIININCRRLSFISRPRLNVNTNCGVPSCHGYTVQAIGYHLTTEETMICTVSCIQIEHNYCCLRQSQQFANSFTKERSCNLHREAFFPLQHDAWQPKITDGGRCDDVCLYMVHTVCRKANCLHTQV